MSEKPSKNQVSAKQLTTQPLVAVQAEFKPEPEPFTLSEALLAIGHLTGRGLLCSECGFRVISKGNGMHSHCNTCAEKHPNMAYNTLVKKASTFEHILCQRLGQWVSEFVGTEG